jgi:hypothetical protein
MISAVQQYFEEMRLALRVLTALNERNSPEQEDVAKLRSLAAGIDRADVDGLACEVITRIIAQRTLTRSGQTASNCSMRDRLGEALRIATHEAEWAIREEFSILARFELAKATEFRRIVEYADERRTAATHGYLQHLRFHSCNESGDFSQPELSVDLVD